MLEMLVKTSSAFSGSELSLTSSDQHAIGLYPEPDESSTYPATLFL
jgi:hypothetical protein